MKKIVEKRNKVNEYIIMLFSFLIFPMPTSVFCLFCGIKKRNKWDTWGGSVLLLSLINITIDWENTDYCWYIPLYKDALVTGFSDYMWSLNGAKEPVYTVLTYILSHIFSGNGILFSLFSTILFYFFMIKGLEVIQKRMGLKEQYFFIGIVLLLFFPYIFANSANHVRQYWATAIVFFAITKVLFEGRKKYWILVGISMFIHTSSGLIGLLSMIPFLKYKISVHTSIYYIGAFLILFLIQPIANALLPFLGDSILNQALTKAAQGTYFETEFTLVKLIFAAFVVGVPLYIVNVYSSEKSSAAIRLINIQLMLTVFIAANLEQEEFCVRMNEYIWCYMPANVMIASSLLRMRGSFIVLFAIAIIVFFILYQVLLTKNTYYCESDFLWQNSIEFFLQSKIK